MEQNELRFYEAAFTLCLGDKEKGLGTIEAINNAVKTMEPLYSKLVYSIFSFFTDFLII